MAAFIPFISAASLRAVIRDGVKAAFGFTIKRAIWLSFIMLAIQVALAVGWILFASPETVVRLFNYLSGKLGLKPVNCSTLPEEVCPLLNIGGFQDMYANACYYAIFLLLVWFGLRSLVMLGRSWYVMRGFGS